MGAQFITLRVGHLTPPFTSLDLPLAAGDEMENIAAQDLLAYPHYVPFTPKRGGKTSPQVFDSFAKIIS